MSASEAIFTARASLSNSVLPHCTPLTSSRGRRRPIYPGPALAEMYSTMYVRLCEEGFNFKMQLIMSPLRCCVQDQDCNLRERNGATNESLWSSCGEVMPLR